MPVSSPSYFPPSRGTDQIVGLTAGQGQTGLRVFLAGQSAGYAETINDVIVIGNNALSAGVQDTGLAGSIAIGTQALDAVLHVHTGDSGPNTAFGYLAGASILYGSNNVLLGSNTLSTVIGGVVTGVQQNVVIGSGAMERMKPDPATSHAANTSVVIGYQAARGVANADASLTSSVVIGHQAALGLGGAVNAGVQQCVVIGAGALPILGTVNGLLSTGVYIGQNVAPFTAGSAAVKNVVIGDSAVINVSAGKNNVAIGGSCSIGDKNNVAVGAAITAGSAAGSNLNIFLGYRAGSLLGGTVANKICIESFDTAIQAALYGDMATGCMLFGNSASAQRGLINTPNGATNILQLPNGTPSLTAPNTSGYFYVTAGALHWVGSAGTDTAIAPA